MDLTYKFDTNSTLKTESLILMWFTIYDLLGTTNRVVVM